MTDNNKQRTPLQEFMSKASESAFRSSPSRLLQTKYESYVNHFMEQVQYQSPLKSVPESNKENNGAVSSPMQWISPVTPPPSFSSIKTPAKYRNPFDANLTEHLHLETFSPSVFSQVLSPSEDQDSNWRIEHVALLNPTDFSPNFQSHLTDPTTEAEAQEKILQFFSQKQIAPSPWSQPRSRILARSKTKTPVEVCKQVTTKNAWTQTGLSFPPTLPPEVEKFLSQYHIVEPQEDTGHSPAASSSEGDDSSLLNASNLRRKLFTQMGNTPSKGEDQSHVTQSRSRSASPILRTGPFSSRFSFSPSTRPVSPPVLSPIRLDELQHESSMAVDETTRQSWDLRQSSSMACGCPMETFETGCLNCSTSTVVQASSRMDLADNSGFGSCKPVECSTPTKS